MSNQITPCIRYPLNRPRRHPCRVNTDPRWSPLDKNCSPLPTDHSDHITRCGWDQGPNVKNWRGPGTIATPMQSLPVASPPGKTCSLLPTEIFRNLRWIYFFNELLIPGVTKICEKVEWEPLRLRRWFCHLTVFYMIMPRLISQCIFNPVPPLRRHNFVNSIINVLHHMRLRNLGFEVISSRCCYY